MAETRLLGKKVLGAARSSCVVGALVVLFCLAACAQDLTNAAASSCPPHDQNTATNAC